MTFKQAISEYFARLDIEAKEVVSAWLAERTDAKHMTSALALAMANEISRECKCLDSILDGEVYPLQIRSMKVMPEVMGEKWR